MKKMSYQTRRRAAYVRHRRDNIPAHQALARARGEAQHHRDLVGDGSNEVALPQGLTLRVRVEYDEWCESPLDYHKNYTYQTHERQEHLDDWLLHSDRHLFIYMNKAAAFEEALSQKWDCAPYSPNPGKHETYLKAMRAVKSCRDTLIRQMRDFYPVGVVVELLDACNNSVGSDGIWGVDMGEDTDYPNTLAGELAVQLLRNYKEKMRVARREVRIATRFARAMENAL